LLRLRWPPLPKSKNLSSKKQIRSGRQQISYSRSS
jgi:hypothetical protein